uniref:Uncharacterized protein n=1 Tax=Cacopsylla melanoneura TaxID=428564 RepID=A0A8D8REW6_9HEMI
MSEHFWASSDSIHLTQDSKPGGAAREFSRKLRRRWSDWELVKICNRGRYQVNVDIKSTSKIYNFCGDGVEVSDDDSEALERARKRQRVGTVGDALKRRRARRRRALSNIESFSKSFPFDDGPPSTISVSSRFQGEYKTMIKLEYNGPFHKVS